MELHITTGKQYRAVRKAASITQEDLAMLLGVSRNTIVRREQDGVNITPEQSLGLRRMIDLLERAEREAPEITE